MRVLFDQGAPAPLRFTLYEHTIITAAEIGWNSLGNGELLAAPEGKFEASITTDQNLQYQQNLSGCSLRILVLTTTSWPRIQRRPDAVAAALATMALGEYRELSFPR
jgi:hypothetical protein